MGAHAILSASSAHRWLHCTPSARLEREFQDTQSEAAAEGTAAHALCEHKLRVALGMAVEQPAPPALTPEMDMHTDDYVAFVLEQLAEAKRHCADPVVLIEQRLDFSCYVPDGFGTGDAVIVGDGVLFVTDMKYGQGLLVDAQDNPQMMLYALGALEQFGALYDIREVAMTIYQPRRENVSTWTIPVDELRAWADEYLMPRAQRAFEGKGDYLPGEWCTFCRAAVKCRARAEAKLTLAKYEFARPPLLTDAEISDMLSQLDDLSRWADDVLSYATEAAMNHGKQWAGFKLVEGRANRKYTNEATAAEAAKAAGFTEIYRQNLIPLTEMERLMGKQRFAEVMGSYVTKPRGKLTLAPAADKRHAVQVSSAKDDFMEVM